MSPEQKAALKERLKAGKAKVAAARAEAKAKGMPDPKPRKARVKAVVNPSSAPEKNNSVPQIQSAEAKNVVADTPIKANPETTKPIDVPVPTLPEDKKDVLKKTNQPTTRKGKATDGSGKPLAINQTETIQNDATGNQAIENMFPGQLETVKKVLKENKKIKAPQEKAEPSPPEKTVKNVKKHIPDNQATAGREPFSFSAVRKILYQ
jgi:hypothetical protein